MLSFKKFLIWILTIVMVFSVIGCSSAPEEKPEETDPPVVEVNNELKEKYPSFFDLDTANGLTVFVAMFAPEGYSCVLFPTGQMNTDSTELMLARGTDLSTMKEILAQYDISPEAITVKPYVNLLSSYLAPELFDDGAIPQLRYRLGIGEKPEEVTEDTNDGPFPYSVSWAGDSEEGEYALRYTYYPITGVYDYKNECTYVAVGVKNRQELENFRSLASRYFSLNASMPNKETFNALAAAYGEEFFQEKGIVIVYIPSESISIGYNLADATLDGEELHITVAEKRPEGELAQQEAGWFMTVELPQEILSQANYFSAGK